MRSVFDGFLRTYNKDEAKRTISQILRRLKQGETVSPRQPVWPSVGSREK